MAKAGKTYRGITYRMLLNEEQEHQLHGMCGACRFVWNFFLARNQAQVATAKENGTAMLSTDWRTLFTEFTQLRNDPEYAWLQEYSFACVRHTLKQLSQAFKNFFDSPAGKPRFKAKHKTTPSFTIPDKVRIAAGKIHIPRVGKVRLRRGGENPYPDGIPKQARVYKQGKNWYLSVTYEIDEPMRVDNGVTAGIDRNASGMIAVAYSDDTPDEVLDHPTNPVYETKRKRKQRKLARQLDRQEEDGREETSNRAKKTQQQIASLSRKEANCRHNRNHQNSARIAEKASTVKVEKLSIKGMTRSAGGTIENPGTNVRQKMGLNRVLLEGAPAQLVQMLGYKCVFVLYVVAAYTSQTCSLCGHIDRNSRATLRKFVCQGCGYEEHADLNAAANILRAPGHGASGRARGVPIRDPDDPSSVHVLVPS